MNPSSTKFLILPPTPHPLALSPPYRTPPHPNPPTSQPHPLTFPFSLYDLPSKRSDSKLPSIRSQPHQQKNSQIPPPHPIKPPQTAKHPLIDRPAPCRFPRYQLYDLLAIQIYIFDRKMSSCPLLPPPSPYKVHFTLRKRVSYGQAVFVCGSLGELGHWTPQKALRLRWNDGDVWTGHLLIHAPPPSFEYKFIISHYDSPSSDCQWEAGAHNRKLDLTGRLALTHTDDYWNMDRIVLHLRTEKSKSQEEKYYVVGDISELGCWREKKLMKRLPRKSGRKENIPHRKRSPSEEHDVYGYSFYTFRGKQQLYYYFIRKGEVVQSERQPGRVLVLGRQNSPHPYRQAVTHPRGQIVVTDQCNIHQLVFSRINSQLYVGGYPRDASDIAKLKSNGVTGILSIQSDKDYKSHGLSSHYLSLLCQQAAVRYQTYPIEDMNNLDFINRAQGAVRKLSDMLHKGGKIYVHCTAGIYRSPQIIALYLAQFQEYSVEEAVEMIKSNHPLARPNCQVISEVYEKQNGKGVLI